MVIAKLSIPGRPVVLKNNKKIATNRKTGRTFIKSNKRVEQYMKRAVLVLRSQWNGKEPFGGSVALKITAYLAGRRDSGNLPDMSNLLQCPEDILQAAGIIEDDRNVEHHDGSRRICLCDGDCPLKQVYVLGEKKGQTKPNCGAVKSCPFERVEIEISKVDVDVACDRDYKKDFKYVCG